MISKPISSMLVSGPGRITEMKGSIRLDTIAFRKRKGNVKSKAMSAEM